MTILTKLINVVLNGFELKKGECVFVGDSINDYIGACDAGVNFIGRIHQNYPNPFNGLEIAGTVSDMNDLAKFVESGELFAGQSR